MAAAYLSTADVDAVITEPTRSILLSDTELAAGYSSTYFTKLNNLASDIVKAAALNSGYDTGDTTNNALVIAATLGQFLVLAYARKFSQPPAHFATLVALAGAIHEGAMPIPGITPTARDAIGGARFTESDPLISDSKPLVFGGLRNLF